MATERRRNPFRKTVQFSVAVRVGKQEALATAVNVSPGGLSVQAGIGPPVGALARLKFTLPGDSRAFTISAKVSWRRPVRGLPGVHRIGFQFHGIGNEEEARLNNYLSGTFLLF